MAWTPDALLAAIAKIVKATDLSGDELRALWPAVFDTYADADKFADKHKPKRPL